MNKNSNIFVSIVGLISYFILLYFLVEFFELFEVLVLGFGVFATIHVIRKTINESRILKAKDRARELNFEMKNRIVGIKKITNLIEEDYKNEIELKNLLQLIDNCSSNSEITACYFSKSKEKNNLLFERIRDFSNKYHLDIGNDELTLEEVTKKCKKLKRKYQKLMRKEEEINESNYQKINRLYKKYCIDNRSVKK